MLPSQPICSQGNLINIQTNIIKRANLVMDINTNTLITFSKSNKSTNVRFTYVGNLNFVLVKKKKANHNWAIKSLHK